MDYLRMNDWGMYELYLDEKFIDNADGTWLGAMNLIEDYGYDVDFAKAGVRGRRVPLKTIED